MLKKILVFGLAATSSALLLKKDVQPIFQGAVNNDAEFASDVGTGDGNASYRNAWNDCGGIGASATETTRAMAAKIKGFPKPVRFVRNASQDCGNAEPARHNFPGEKIWKAANDGLATAEKALEK